MWGVKFIVLPKKGVVTVCGHFSRVPGVICGSGSATNGLRMGHKVVAACMGQVRLEQKHSTVLACQAVSHGDPCYYESCRNRFETVGNVCGLLPCFQWFS